jgi:cytochrome-b5 reductase
VTVRLEEEKPRAKTMAGLRLMRRLASTAAPAAIIGPPVASLVPPGVCQLNEQWTVCRLMKKEEISHNVATFTFALPDTSKPLNLSTCAAILARGDAVDATGNRAVRPYTPVSTNATVGTFTLLVKRYPEGLLSKAMHELPLGSKLDFQHIAPNVKKLYPFGAKRIGMIAGGTGITPCIQALHAILGTPSDESRVSLVYAAQTQEDLLAKETLDAWASSHDRFEVTYVLSGEPASSSWSGARGFVDAELIRKHLPPPADDSLILVCGPPPMYDALSGPRLQKHLTGALADLAYRAEQVYKF